MARIYSQSQGKFIDVPDQGGTSPTTTPSAGSPDLATILKQVLGIKLIGSGKVSQQVQGVNLLQPTAAQEQAKQKAADEAAGKQKQINQLKAIEDLYFGNDLAKGGLPGLLSNLGATNIPLTGTSISPNSPYSLYRDTLRSQLASLAKAGGDTGNIGYLEQLLQLSAFPTAMSNPESAKKKFNLVRQRFGLPTREDFSTTGVPGTSTAGAGIYGKSLKLDQ